MATLDFRKGDWVKCRGERKVLWVYGWIQTINDAPSGKRIYVNRGYLDSAWFHPYELSPAFDVQSPEELAALEDALKRMANSFKTQS